MAITFDPASKRIILDSAFADAADIYSRWKDWVRTSTNSKYLPAFSVVGGDPLGGGLFVASYFFLLNDWRIRPMEASHTLILEGNILSDGGAVPIVPTLGTYNVSAQYSVPVQAQGIATSGSTGPTASEIASAVRSEISAELAKIQQMTFAAGGMVANLKYVNNTLVGGSGTEMAPWGPA